MYFMGSLSPCDSKFLRFLIHPRKQITHKLPFTSLRAAGLARATTPASRQHSLCVVYYREVRTFFHSPLKKKLGSGLARPAPRNAR